MRSPARWPSCAQGATPTVTFFLCATLLLTACEPPRGTVRRVALSDGWEVSLASESPGPDITGHLADPLSSWIPATVPGTVHTDLLANGLIPDPFWSDGELNLQWIGEEDWVYRTTISVEPELLDEDVVDLVFHGLDTFAEVSLNGSVILQADNMFRTWTTDVKGTLQTGENELEIRFASPLAPALEARASLPYELPAGNDRGDPPSRVFVRKAAYHYGWDWGPRFVTSGIWKPIEIVGWSGARFLDLHFVTDSLSDGTAFMRGVAEVQVSQEEADLNAGGVTHSASLAFSSPDGAFDPVHLETQVAAGITRLEAAFRVSDPQLWWTNGLGEPHLYSARAELGIGSAVDSLSTRFGIRTLDLVTEPDSIGESFFFRLNGVPVFMKGANIIPLDHFSPRVAEEDYRGLFTDVVDANMNMLRVWGGGIYEEDIFYDLADEYGVLIWQDFMFANGMYPGDSLFLENIRAEATDQVRRLRRHPSLGWGDPESLNRGDSHYWGIWHGQEPFQVFLEKLPRFSSEFGFQAFPSIETVAAFSDTTDWSLTNPNLLVHQKHPIGNQIITTYMARDYPVPAEFTDFVYVSQLLQARGMRMAFEAQRRAMPRTMGTLYWQLNDTWPVVSWSSRDYFGRWKALHFAAQDAFAPLLLSPVLRGDTVEVWGVSDRPESVDGTLHLELVTFQGATVWESEEPASLPANESTLLWDGATSTLLGVATTVLGEGVSERVVLIGSVEDADGESLAPPSLLYFRTPGELDLEAPTIRFTADKGPEGVSVTLETDVLAKSVYLSLGGARFSDNFFDLLPGRPRTLIADTNLSEEEVEARLAVRTLAEIPREGVRVDEAQAGESGNQIPDPR